MLADLDHAGPARRIGCIGTICVVHFNPKARNGLSGHLKRLTTTAIPLCIEISRPKRRNGAAYLHRHRRSRTGDTQLSPMGVTWGSAALGPCSLRIGSQELTVRHGPIVPRCRKRAANAISQRIKKAKQDGGRHKNRTRVKPSPLVFCPTPIAPPKPTSAPTSTRDEPHVGTHICARPLKYTNPEFLERSRERSMQSLLLQR